MDAYEKYCKLTDILGGDKLADEMFSNSYTYRYFITVMSVADKIIRDYDLEHCKDGDCWSITVLYNTHTILTLNSAMF